MATTIMIVANDKATTNTLASHFGKKEFSLVAVHSGRQALLQSKSRKPEAIIIDATSPRLNVKRLSRALRSETRALIVALSANPGKVDYRSAHLVLARSISPRKLIQRIRSELDDRPPHQMRFGGLILDLERRRVTRGTRSIKLTPKEFELLRLLMNHPDEIVSRVTIMRQIWDTDYLGDTRTLDVHIRWLREKIEDSASAPSRLVTVRGKGYRLAKGKE